MNVGSLFTGIGGLDLGLERAGMRVVFQAEGGGDPNGTKKEREQYAQGVWRRSLLRERFPGVELYDDVACVAAGDDGARPAGGGMDDERWEEACESPPLTVHSAGQRTLISSAEASPAKTSPSPDDAPDSPESAPASGLSSPESLTLFDPDTSSSRTYPDCSPRTAVGTSESCLERWPTSGMAWRGGLSTAVTSECRSDEGGCSSSEPSLTEILEPPRNVPAKYSLSARAARGILRRAEKRGRTLPAHLAEALAQVAGMTETPSTGGGTRPCRDSGAEAPMTTTHKAGGS